ncbi:MAG: hypothetical protein MUC85_12510 [Anaerolineales bacterium]|nr:hypothetical protein [Anaerolineales bacterium]
MKHILLKLGLFLILAGLFSACSQPALPTPVPTNPAPVSIDCHAFYRASVNEMGGWTRNLILTREDSQKTVEFPDLVFRVYLLEEYVSDESGNSSSNVGIKIWVFLPGENDELLGLLYQDIEIPDVTAYVAAGGHGFTGLHYVYNPTSRAELQFWCVAK